MGSSSLNLESLLASSLKELTQLADRYQPSPATSVLTGPRSCPLPTSLQSIFALGIAGMVPGWASGSWFPRPRSPPFVLVTALSSAYTGSDTTDWGSTLK